MVYVRTFTSEKTRHSPNGVSMLVHLLRRWPSIETAVCQRLEAVFSGQCWRSSTSGMGNSLTFEGLFADWTIFILPCINDAISTLIQHHVLSGCLKVYNGQKTNTCCARFPAMDNLSLMHGGFNCSVYGST